MSKRNSVSYIKPEEPNFIRKLKEQIGYIEPDTIETKKQVLPSINDEDLEDKEDEKPVVVVLKSGDLTAEEVDNQKKEEATTPADLSKPVVFRAPKRSSESELAGTKNKSQKKNDRLSQKTSASLLSFDQEDNEED